MPTLPTPRPTVEQQKATARDLRERTLALNAAHAAERSLAERDPNVPRVLPARLAHRPAMRPPAPATNEPPPPPEEPPADETPGTLFNPLVSVAPNAYAVSVEDLPAAVLDRAIQSGFLVRDSIIAPDLRGQVEEIRRVYAEAERAGADPKKAVEKLKAKLPSILWSGTFTDRKKPVAPKLKQYSGLLCADLDHLTAEQIAETRVHLRTSPHLLRLFLSPTGRGLKPVFRVASHSGADWQEAERHHTACWQAVKRHVLELTGFSIDEAAKDIGRLCFASYDPEAFFNPHATPLIVTAKDKASAAKEKDNATPLATAKDKPPATEPGKPLARRLALPAPEPLERKAASLELLAELLSHIPADPEHNWFRVTGALKRHGKETGQLEKCEALADEWARTSDKYDEAEQIKLWDRLDREPGENVATVGTIFHLAKEHGWKPGPRQQKSKIVAELAKLDPLEYDRVRKQKADELGCRTSTLDAEVVLERQREQGADSGGQGQALAFENVEPWSEAVNLDEILLDMGGYLAELLVLPDEAYTVLPLWVAHTFCFECFDYSPILHVKSPAKRCGKSRALDFLKRLVCRPLKTSNASGAALFRAIEKWNPCCLVDEYDSACKEGSERAEDLRNILNAGYERGNSCLRCSGVDFEPRLFNVYGPKAVAGIGALPDTAADRAIILPMRRKLKTEKVKRLREFTAATNLQRKLTKWAQDNAKALREARPALPPQLDDRASDVWEPLLAIAEAAGGEWPQWARVAAVKLSAQREGGGETHAERLLRDIRSVFDEKQDERLETDSLLLALNQMVAAPWPTLFRGKPLNAHRLGRMLAEFGIEDRRWRTGRGDSPYGFYRADFEDVWTHYG